MITTIESLFQNSLSLIDPLASMPPTHSYCSNYSSPTLRYPIIMKRNHSSILKALLTLSTYHPQLIKDYALGSHYLFGAE